jgi:hypothetical protein
MAAEPTNHDQSFIEFTTLHKAQTRPLRGCLRKPNARQAEVFIFPWRPDVRGVVGGWGLLVMNLTKKFANGNSKNRERPTTESTFGQ